MLTNNSTNPNILKKGALFTFNENYLRYPPLYTQFSLVIQSTTSSEDHVGTGAAPGMREMIDELRPNSINDYLKNLRNIKYESSLYVNQDLIDDQQQGQFNSVAGNMAVKAAIHPDVKVAEALQDNGTGLDGNTFFSTAHSNLLTGNQFNEANLGKAVKALRTQKDDKGQIINIIPRVVMIPANLEVSARKTVQAALVSGGDTNVIRSLGMTILVNPYLDSESDTTWYLVGGNSGVVFQNRKSPEFAAIDPRTSGDTADNWLFRVISRFAVGLGDHNQIIRSNA